MATARYSQSFLPKHSVFLVILLYFLVGPLIFEILSLPDKSDSLAAEIQNTDAKKKVPKRPDPRVPAQKKPPRAAWFSGIPITCIDRDRLMINDPRAYTFSLHQRQLAEEQYQRETKKGCIDLSSDRAIQQQKNPDYWDEDKRHVAYKSVSNTRN